MKEATKTQPNASTVDATTPNPQAEIHKAALALFRELDMDTLKDWLIDYARLCNNRDTFVDENIFYLYSHIEGFHLAIKPLV